MPPRVRPPSVPGSLPAVSLARRLAIFVLVFMGCARRDPWAPCRAGGDVGFGPAPPTCSTPACLACAATLDRAYRTAPEVLRTRFIRAPADAREAFLRFTHPTGPYPDEHCTAGLARGARCAAYSPYCVDVLATGLRSGDTTLAQRGQYTQAASDGCPAARAMLVAALRLCEPPPAGPGCTDAHCQNCEAGHLAALTVVAPDAVDPEHATELRELVDHTPEPVARAIVENLGAPDAPADIETAAVQRGLRAWCFSLVDRSATAPPYACNATMSRFLQHTEYGDSPVAWAAVTHARPAVRAQIVAALLTDLGRHGAIPAEVATRLRDLPAEGTVEAITQVMRAAPTPATVYTALRELLAQRGVTDLPPETPPTSPASGPQPQTPAPAPTGGRTLGPVPGAVHAG